MTDDTRREAPPTLWTREHEVQISVETPDGVLCKSSGKPLAYGRFAWDHRITSDWYFDGPWQLGEDAFKLWRHADGTPPCSEIECWPKARCGKCGAYESFKVTLEAYGDRIDCEACGDSRWHDIGD